jgi:nucleotide-binding universal stress UspA family protein
MAFDKILVPTDFSIHAREAIETAIELAMAFNSSLHLVHAYYFDIPPTYIPGEAAPFINQQDILDSIRERAQESMDWLTKEIGARGIDVDGKVVLGHASEVILAEAEQLPASTIVIGTHGHTGLKHVLLGSIAERVVRMAPCPVLTVKAIDSDNNSRAHASSQ